MSKCATVRMPVLNDNTGGRVAPTGEPSFEAVVVNWRLTRICEALLQDAHIVLLLDSLTIEPRMMDRKSDGGGASLDRGF